MIRHGFWSACEMLVGPAAVEAEWRQLTGEEYEAAEAFLRPVQELATSYPCPRSYPCGCYHEVVIHSEDDIVAVCTCNPRVCNTVPVAKSDIVVYELDRPALHSAIAEALSLELKEADVPHLRGTTHVGIYSPQGGCHLPVFLTIRMAPRDFRHVVFGLAAKNREPFILIAPTGRLCDPYCIEILEQNGSTFLALSDLLALDSGTLTVNEHCVEVFARSWEKKTNIAGHDLRIAKHQTVNRIPESVLRHAEGFRIVWLHERRLEMLSKTQAEVVKVLYEAAEDGRPEMSFGAIAVRMENPPSKMSNIFRKSDSRSVLIKRVKNDIYHLNL